MAQMETGRRSGYERELSCGRFSKDRRAAAQEKELNAAFDARLQADRSTWRVDMTKCPYYDTCVQYGCPELCPCFCDSDDITCANLHPKLLRHRTGTLGRGNACCDFCLRIKESLGACEAGHPAFL